MDDCDGGGCGVSTRRKSAACTLRLPDVVKRVPIKQLNPYLMCALCNGYLVDAVTMVECLHSFCRSCLLNYFEKTPMCPLCQTPINKNRWQGSIRSDQTLQDLVYKLVPGLYGSELKRRKQFYLDHCTNGCSENNGSNNSNKSNNVKILHIFDKHLVDLASCICSPDEILSFSIEFLSPQGKIESDKDEALLQNNLKFKRYFRCPAAVKIGHLKRLLALKLDLSSRHRVAIWYADETQDDDLSLMDIAYIYSWKRKTPLQFYFNVYKLEMEEEIMPELPPQVEIPSQQNTDHVTTAPRTPENQNISATAAPPAVVPLPLFVAPLTMKLNKITTKKRSSKKSLASVVQNLVVYRTVDSRGDDVIDLKRDSSSNPNMDTTNTDDRLFDSDNCTPAKKPKTVKLHRNSEGKTKKSNKNNNSTCESKMDIVKKPNMSLATLSC